LSNLIVHPVQIGADLDWMTRRRGHADKVFRAPKHHINVLVKKVYILYRDGIRLSFPASHAVADSVSSERFDWLHSTRVQKPDCPTKNFEATFSGSRDLQIWS